MTGPKSATGHADRFDIAPSYDRGVMFFALLFIVIPIVEIFVAIQVAHVIGGLNTVGLLLLISLVGAWLTKQAGFSVISRIRGQLESRHMPTNELIDGGIVVTGGILLIVPGFVTGAVGLLLLFPPTRVLARNVVKRRFVGRVQYFPGPSGTGHIESPDDIIDV